MSILSLALSSVLANNVSSAEELRRSARVWEARDRVDLARQALEKLTSLRGARSDDLLLLGEVDLRQGDLLRAQQVLVQLQREFPSSPEARTFATEVRVASQDRLALASVHRLVQLGRGDEVRAALVRVFPDGAPNGMLGVEYYELLAAATDGRLDAQNGLVRLMRMHPNDPRYVLPLARLLSRRAQTARAAIRLLEPLMGRVDVRSVDYHEILNLAQATLAQAPADTLEESLPAWHEPIAKDAPRVKVPSAMGSSERVTRGKTIGPKPDPVIASGTSVPDSSLVQKEPQPPAVDVWTLYREAQRLFAAGDEVAAQALMRQMSEIYPASVDARFAAALWAESRSERDLARQLADAIPPDERGEGVRSLLARLESSARPELPSPSVRAAVVPDQVSWSLQWLNKPGDAGISSLKSVVLPIEWRHALANNSQLGVMAEAVSLDAGHVPLTVAEAGGIGTVAVSGLGVRAGAPTATQGIALGLAWHHRDWVVDLGTTPLGFAISRWTGGVRYAPTLAGLDTSIEAFRRTVTSSLLSYAGRIDPATGRIWGGVVESGVAGRIGRYERDSSISLAVRASRLQGTEVATNKRYTARLSADQVVARPLRGNLAVGVAIGYQSYERNLLGYTLGNGGYFSPQSYSSFALPLEWTRRADIYSLQVRVAPTLTHRHDADAPWFPNNPLASAAVIAAGGEPRVLGGSVNGRSVALSLVFERRMTRGVVGIAFEHDRSDYYRPVSLMLYFRPGIAPGDTFAPRQPYMRY
jgi:hypothetical protein